MLLLSQLSVVLVALCGVVASIQIYCEVSIAVCLTVVLVNVQIYLVSSFVHVLHAILSVLTVLVVRNPSVPVKLLAVLPFSGIDCIFFVTYLRSLVVVFLPVLVA